MNFYKQKLKIQTELEERKEKMKDMSDCILDVYTKYPEDCKHLLIELNSLTKELEDLELEVEELFKEFEV